ncbi:MAG: CBS domain-containing protein [Candidatus Heimdallarchaeota archaeon]|nr:MAG: CBS domain-containing protein [Candidatus Heimdallarchaeota archaeon]
MEKDKEFFIRDLTIDDEYDIINADSTVKDAALKMKELGIPDLVVVDNDNNVLGVIADFDIVTGLVAEGLSAETAKVTEIMYTIEPVYKDTPVSTAFTRMRDLDVSVVPVVENEELIGVATITDCWGFLPEKYEDQKGLIAISNPRFANYGFTILMTLLYFCFGILAPFAGFSGFIKAPIAGSAIGSQITTYGLFDARGGGFYISYLGLQGTYSLLWLAMFIYGVIFLLLGIFSMWSIIHWANADYHLVQITRNWQAIGLVVGIVNLLIEWSLFFIVLMIGALRVPSSQISLDLFGLLLSGLAIIFLIAAASRDILFRESMSSPAKEE